MFIYELFIDTLPVMYEQQDGNLPRQECGYFGIAIKHIPLLNNYWTIINSKDIKHLKHLPLLPTIFAIPQAIEVALTSYI